MIREQWWQDQVALDHLHSLDPTGSNSGVQEAIADMVQQINDIKALFKASGVIPLDRWACKQKQVL